MRQDFKQYVAAQHAPLLRMAYLLTGDRAVAEDLVGTALAHAWLKWRRLRDRGAVDAYVRRVLLTKVCRRRRPRKLGLTPEQAEADGPHGVLWTALGGLPPRQRAVLVLHFYEDLQVDDIALLLGVSSATVDATLARALNRLHTRTGHVPGWRDGSEQNGSAWRRPRPARRPPG